MKAKAITGISNCCSFFHIMILYFITPMVSKPISWVLILSKSFGLTFSKTIPGLNDSLN